MKIKKRKTKKLKFQRKIIKKIDQLRRKVVLQRKVILSLTEGKKSKLKTRIIGYLITNSFPNKPIGCDDVPAIYGSNGWWSRNAISLVTAKLVAAVASLALGTSLVSSKLVGSLR